jgi:hypothetical protein
MKTLRINKASQIAAALAVASCLFHAASARADVLLFDDFSDGNYTSDPAWTATQGTWTVSDDAAHTSGSASNNYLRTQDFTKIENGTFTFSLDVKFSSSTVTGDNRFYMRMRDSANSLAGYEVAIAQGTMANTNINLLGGATITGMEKTNSPYTFPLDTYVTITWERLASGAMTIYVGDQLYMSVTDSSVSNFDTLEIGGRVGIGTPVTTIYNYSFTNIELSTVPEPGSAGLLLGAAGGAFLMAARRRPARACHTLS